MDASEARQSLRGGRYLGGSPRIRSHSVSQLAGADYLGLTTGGISPLQDQGQLEGNYLDSMPRAQGGHLVIWGDNTDFRSYAGRPGSSSDVGKTDVTWTRGVSRRTTKKIEYFEPVSGEHDLLSDAGSCWSFSSVGSSASSNKPPALALKSTRSDVGPATRLLKDDDQVADWFQLQGSRSLPPRPSRTKDEQDTFTGVTFLPSC